MCNIYIYVQTFINTCLHTYINLYTFMHRRTHCKFVGIYSLLDPHNLTLTHNSRTDIKTIELFRLKTHQ